MDSCLKESHDIANDDQIISIHFQHKLVVLKISLIFAVFISATFTVLNFNQGNFTLSVVLAFEGIIYLFLFYIAIRVQKFFKHACSAFILIFFTSCLFFYYSTKTDVTVFLWSIVCCFLAQFFFESKAGTLVSIVFMAITFLLLFRRYFLDPETMSTIALSQLSVVSLGALVFSIYYEKRRVKAENALKKANQQLENMANRDGLTGLFNRRYFDQILKNEWLRLQRNQGSLSLILADIDYFKKYNDHYGHVAGDECLQNVADTFQHSVKRVSDVAARYGGEEFAVIMPDTDSDGAQAIAQSIKTLIRDKAIPHEASNVKDYVTMSIGIASIIPDSSIDCGSFIEMADKALYQSKENGRNMISVNKEDI